MRASGVFNYSQPNGLDSGQFPNRFRHLDRAISAFDRPRSFALAMQYVTKGPWWMRNIQVSPIITGRDGLPGTISQNNLHPAATQQRPSVSGTNSGG